MDELLRAAVRFYEARPWEGLVSHNIIEVRNLKTGKYKVAQVCGYGYTRTLVHV